MIDGIIHDAPNVLRRQDYGTRATTKDYQLSRSCRLDAGDGPGGSMLQAHQTAAPSRNLRIIKPASQGRGFDTREYRRGTREKKSRRISSTSFDRERVAQRIGNSSLDRRAAQLFYGERNCSGP